MNPSFDFSGRDVDMNALEDLTTNVKQIQDDVLEEIVSSNMNTEYLRRFLSGDSFDKELFKKNVPVVTYEDVKPYIERIANGEPSDVISAEPITCFYVSTGTSGGVPKMMPVNNKYLETLRIGNSLRVLVMSKHVDHCLQQGKGMVFYICRPDSKTPCGIPITNATSAVFRNNKLKNQPSNWSTSSTSPIEVILCPNHKQSLYCHLLCGLVQRDEVVRVGSFFASVLVQAIKLLEDSWEEMCSNIRSGHVSDWITDLSCKDSVSQILRGPRPELADAIEKDCSRNSWEGIITRLWPRTKYIESVVTGSMAQYISALQFYSNSLPIISMTYASSETYVGINLDPLCKPEDVSYTILPNMSYFEFLPVEENEDEIVDLANVKLGRYYEVVVTNFSGLYRIKMGDIVLVTGFYNNAPQFRFVRRENVVLSVHTEKTTEEELLKAVNRAKLVLDSSDLMLMDFTSYADTSTYPGHYVLYWELKAKTKDLIPSLDPKVLSMCCFQVEESLDAVYRKFRSKELGYIGALEIKVVRQGTFDSLMNSFVSQSGSMGQYKTPLCIKSTKALEVLENGVIGRFIGEKYPS